MFVMSCPICGRQPKIDEGISVGSGIRRRFCGCPNFCSVLPSADGHRGYRAWFMYFGDGDDNTILKLWNAGVARYLKNKDLDWRDKDWSKWSSDPHLKI